MMPEGAAQIFLDSDMDILELYKKVLLIRFFEEKVDRLFSRGVLGGTTHLCIGQEAVPVGVISRLRKEDYVVSNHRGHGHLIAKGADIQKIFSELLGRTDGYCRGKGGTQHLSAMDINFLGTNGITGGGIPIATGAALRIKISGEHRVAVCFFGDGAVNQGTFHESLNMAAVWKLPVLYVCENNLYGMSTRFSKVSATEDVAKRARSYGIQSVITDGMDAVGMAKLTDRVVERIRGGGGPFLIEAKTYRFCGHSKSDPRSYRSRQEEDEWRKKDPLKKLESLLRKGPVGPELDAVKEQIRKQVEEAYLRAEREGREPDREDAFGGVYAEAKGLLQGGRIQGARRGLVP